MLERPSKELWENWVRHPVTQFYLTALQDKREQIKEGLAQGKSGYDVKHPDFITYVGQCIAIEDALLYATKDFEHAERKRDKIEGEEENHDN